MYKFALTSLLSALVELTCASFVSVFVAQKRQPFVYRDCVPWSEFAEVLVKLFKNNTGRELEKEHLSYLAKIALSKICYL